MTYFKIVINNNIIGVVTSKQFVRYSSAVNTLLRCNKELGEYVTYKSILYRDSWMNPTITDAGFTWADIEPISQTEYDILLAALQKDDEVPIVDGDDDPPVPEPEPIPEDTSSIDFIRSSKLAELSRACRAAIESGIDLELQGEIHHFSLTTQDQLNLMSLSATAQTQDLIPYHADGELYTYYTAAEINSIIKAANDYKVYHTAYYNSLKAYVNALTTIEEIAAVTYGTEVPDEYKSDVLRVLE